MYNVRAQGLENQRLVWGDLIWGGNDYLQPYLEVFLEEQGKQGEVSYKIMMVLFLLLDTKHVIGHGCRWPVWYFPLGRYRPGTRGMVWWVEKGWIFGLKSPYLQCYMNPYYHNPLSPLYPFLSWLGKFTHRTASPAADSSPTIGFYLPMGIYADRYIWAEVSPLR